jgi:hypothetical protein
VKLDDDAPAEKSASAPAAAHGSGLESNAPSAPPPGADTPGF